MQNEGQAWVRIVVFDDSTLIKHDVYEGTVPVSKKDVTINVPASSPRAYIFCY